MGARAGLDRCGKSRPHRNSIPGPPSPLVSRYTDVINLRSEATFFCFIFQTNFGAYALLSLYYFTII
jgi:hypothetical protein